MGSWDYYRGTLRDYHTDPFPHSLLRTREAYSYGGFMNLLGLVHILSLQAFRRKSFCFRVQGSMSAI